MALSQTELLQKALNTVYVWANGQGYGPTCKPNKANPTSLTFMKGEVMLKLAIKGEELEMITMPKTQSLEDEVDALLGRHTMEDDFEDEPIDFSEPEEVVQEEVAPAVPDKPTKPAAVKPRQPAVPKKKESEVKEKWDDYARQQKSTYDISGREALTAFGVSELMNKAGLCSEIVKVVRTKETVQAIVRCIDPSTGHYRDDSKTIDRETFWVMKAMDIALSQEKKRAGFVVGYDEEGRPQLNPSRTVGGTPAPIWMAQQLMRAWHSADGIAVTSAERRAALKMLNREWREDDEVESEIAEAEAVAQMK